jgi:regulatory protein
LCHKLGVMRRSQARKPRPPLDPEQLNEVALFYVGRYATTRAKLAGYLQRKVRERGWTGEPAPDIERLVERFAETGLVDDASFALAKSRSLSERGYGARRVRQALRAAGIDEADGQGARELAAAQAVDAALRFARRRRIGPFAVELTDRQGREKALAAMIRAGHDFELARTLVDLRPGSEVDLDELRSKTA